MIRREIEMLARGHNESPVRAVTGSVNYIGPMEGRPVLFDFDRSRDRLAIDSRSVTISDARGWSEPPDLDREGFTLVQHRSVVQGFRNYGEQMEAHRRETESLLLEISGADQVVLTTPGAFRFSEKSPLAGNARSYLPGRQIHIDYSDAAAKNRAAQLASGGLEKVHRFAHYNVWRVLSPPPQDAPLTVCDARSVDPRDFVVGDVIADTRNSPEWSFETLFVRHNPRHRWVYWSNMRSDEALIFKANDSDPTRAHSVPHAAFDDPTCPAGAAPRISIEMRGVAYWLA
jgi:hypothetical protein